MVPVITNSIVAAVVVGGSNSLQLFSQQVSMKPGCDGQHPASVTPHIDVHLWHLSEIQLYRRYGFISSTSQQKDETKRGAELFCRVSTIAGCTKYSTNSDGLYWSRRINLWSHYTDTGRKVEFNSMTAKGTLRTSQLQSHHSGTVHLVIRGQWRLVLIGCWQWEVECIDSRLPHFGLLWDLDKNRGCHLHLNACTDTYTIRNTGRLLFFFPQKVFVSASPPSLAPVMYWKSLLKAIAAPTPMK